jgi:hypothetical protein
VTTVRSAPARRPAPPRSPRRRALAGAGGALGRALAGLWRVLGGLWPAIGGSWWTSGSVCQMPDGSWQVFGGLRRVPGGSPRVSSTTFRARWWPDPWWHGAVLGAVAVAGLALFFVPLAGVNLGQLNGLGLISVLPVLSLLGVVAAVVAFSVAVCLPRAYPVVLGVALAGIVVCLDAVTVFTETDPRFPTAYQIAGFVEYVSRTGHTAPGLDAYFSWPGFFAAVAFLQHLTGNHDLIPVLRWWPVTIDLACLAPLYLILRNLRASWRAKWLAAFLFEVGNWVGQDYFSPQSFNYLLYLTFVAILLTWFGLRAGSDRDRTRVRPARGMLGWPYWWWRIRFDPLEPGETEARRVTRGQRGLLLAVVLAIFVFSVTSHQLTPFDMIAACLGLVVVRRCTVTGLPVLLAVIVSAWVSFAAVGFWSGHLSALFGDLGNFGGNLTSSVADRMTGTAQHLHVLDVRTLFAAVVLLMAVAGLNRRWRRGIDDRVLITLMVMPFLAFATQSYGGEIALRVYLFALPAAAVLAAYLFFPAAGEDGRARLWRAIPVSLCCVAMVLGFFVARYGNEEFEQTPPGEVAAFNYLYAHDQGGIRLLWLSPNPAVDNTPQMPWEYRDIEKIEFLPELAPPDPGGLSSLVATLRAQGPNSYLITTSTQETYLTQEASYESGWGTQFRAQMAATPGVRVVYANADAVIYALRFPAGTPAHPLAQSTASPPARATIWTPAGLAVLVLLLLVLIAREFARICLGAPRRIMRWLTVISLPLLVAFVVVVSMRFIVIA